VQHHLHNSRVIAAGIIAGMSPAVFSQELSPQELSPGEFPAICCRACQEWEF